MKFKSFFILAVFLCSSFAQAQMPWAVRYCRNTAENAAGSLYYGPMDNLVYASVIEGCVQDIFKNKISEMSALSCNQLFNDVKERGESETDQSKKGLISSFANRISQICDLLPGEGFE